ncbi:MAG: hypothetical protein IKY94_01610 [Lachnospiraceae bacterium]|nr:hypothetical protein [Lachnospiraceae bacterium]
MKKYNEKQFVARLEIYILLRECVKYKNIRNKDLIVENLNMLNGYKGVVPDKIYKKMQDFITDEIRPILYDPNYFDFMEVVESDDSKDESCSELTLEERVEMKVCKLYERTLELAEKIDEFVSVYLY